MKKVVLVLLLAVVVLGSQAWARGPHHTPGDCPRGNPEQCQQLMKDSDPIRQSMWDKQKQVRALLAKPESDPAQIGALEKEIAELRTTLREKAQSAGISCPNGGPGSCMGMGMGHGRRGGCMAMQ